LKNHNSHRLQRSCSGQGTAFKTAISFPARGYADLAAKLAFARTERTIKASMVPSSALAVTFDALTADVSRLANATPPEAADDELFSLATECEAAFDVNKALWARLSAQREAAEKELNAAGYREPVGHSLNFDWGERTNAVLRKTPGSYERANEAHKEMGRAARAVFAVKARTIRGAIAKLGIVLALINADELDTWQPVDRDWLAETLADYERIERGEQRK
jgi:hypothetical protein